MTYTAVLASSGLRDCRVMHEPRFRVGDDGALRHMGGHAHGEDSLGAFEPWADARCARGHAAVRVAVVTGAAPPLAGIDGGDHRRLGAVSAVAVARPVAEFVDDH